MWPRSLHQPAKSIWNYFYMDQARYYKKATNIDKIMKFIQKIVC